MLILLATSMFSVLIVAFAFYFAEGIFRNDTLKNRIFGFIKTLGVTFMLVWMGFVLIYTVGQVSGYTGCNQNYLKGDAIYRLVWQEKVGEKYEAILAETTKVSVFEIANADWKDCFYRLDKPVPGKVGDYFKTVKDENGNRHLEPFYFPLIK